MPPNSRFLDYCHPFDLIDTPLQHSSSTHDGHDIAAEHHLPPHHLLHHPRSPAVDVPSSRTTATDLPPHHPLPEHMLRSVHRLEPPREEEPPQHEEPEYPEYLVDLPLPPWAGKSLSGWRRRILNLTPAFFSMNMGTGVVSILLHNQPYPAQWLRILSYIVFAFNVVLFLVLLTATILRYVLYPELLRALFRHPTQSLYVATMPMGLSTIINMLIFACAPHWGSWVKTLAACLWAIDAVLSIACFLVLPIVMMFKHPQFKPTDMTAVWLFPLIPNVVVSATGGVVADSLDNPTHSLWILIVCFIMWSMAIPMTFAVVVIYFNRLVCHKLPPREIIVSVFLPCGPAGQGAFGIMTFGRIARRIFPLNQTLPAVRAAGDILYVNSMLAGGILWAFGLVWLVFAFASVARTRFPFNMGSWACIFPIGVWVTATIVIGKELPSVVFNVIAIIFTIVTIIFWLVVASLSIRKAYTGDLFFDPCVAAFECRAYKEKPNSSSDSTA